MKTYLQDFPGGSVVETSPSNAGAGQCVMLAAVISELINDV